MSVSSSPQQNKANYVSTLQSSCKGLKMSFMIVYCLKMCVIKIILSLGLSYTVRKGPPQYASEAQPSKQVQSQTPAKQTGAARSQTQNPAKQSGAESSQSQTSAKQPGAARSQTRNPAKQSGAAASQSPTPSKQPCAAASGTAQIGSPAGGQVKQQQGPKPAMGRGWGRGADV